jgi:hypothetical protein
MKHAPLDNSESGPLYHAYVRFSLQLGPATLSSVTWTGGLMVVYQSMPTAHKLVTEITHVFSQLLS